MWGEKKKPYGVKDTHRGLACALQSLDFLLNSTTVLCVRLRKVLNLHNKQPQTLYINNIPVHDVYGRWRHALRASEWTVERWSCDRQCSWRVAFVRLRSKPWTRKHLLAWSCRHPPSSTWTYEFAHLWRHKNLVRACTLTEQCRQPDTSL